MGASFEEQFVVAGERLDHISPVREKEVLKDKEFFVSAKVCGPFTGCIEKGIPLASGLGGSAASAVAAVVAGNALLARPFEKLALLRFAMAGEVVASGSVRRQWPGVVRWPGPDRRHREPARQAGAGAGGIHCI
jgi:mevalonate kinase